MSLPEAASAQPLETFRNSEFQGPETEFDCTVNAEAVYGQRVRAATATFFRALSAPLGPGTKQGQC